MTTPPRYDVYAFDHQDTEQRQALVRLFENTHNPCFCRYWHFSGDKNEWLDRCATRPEENQGEMMAAASTGSDETYGIIARDVADGEVIGWLKLNPARALRKIYGQRVYRALPCLRDDQEEGRWAVGCLLVHPSHRRCGVAQALIAQVPEVALRYRARCVDAFPWLTEGERNDETLLMGPLRSFLAAGFFFLHTDETYPILRWTAVLLCKHYTAFFLSMALSLVTLTMGPPCVFLEAYADAPNRSF